MTNTTERTQKENMVLVAHDEAELLNKAIDETVALVQSLSRRKADATRLSHAFDRMREAFNRAEGK